MSHIEMPTAPTGTRWFAKPAGEGWLVLYLGSADWSDEQIQHPDHDLYMWPNSMPGICGTSPECVVSMAHSLIRRMSDRFPAAAEGGAMADAINSGAPLPVVVS